MKKWFIFISLWLAATVAAYGQYQLNVYALDIMAEYGISTPAFASLHCPHVPGDLPQCVGRQSL